MSKFWKTEKFSELSAEWEKRLEQSGFIDVEKQINGDRVLKSYDSSIHAKTKVYKTETILFYELVDNAKLRDNTLNEKETIILDAFTQGKKQKDIIKELNNRGIAINNRWTIYLTIRKFLRKWKIPHYRKSTKKN